MEERRKHHHFLTFRHSSFEISSSSDIMRRVPGSGWGGEEPPLLGSGLNEVSARA